MQHINESLSSYEAAWNATDPGERLSLLQQCWHENGIYTDPHNRVEGRDALCTCIGEFHTAMPQVQLRITSAPDAHHNQLRIQWVMQDAQSGIVGEGASFGEIDNTGQLTRMTGFFGPFPEPIADGS